MSVFKGVSISALMRIATQDLIKKEDPSGGFLAQARKSREKQYDTPKQRAHETLDPEILELAKNLQKKLTR